MAENSLPFVFCHLFSVLDSAELVAGCPLYPVSLKNVAISLRVNPGNFSGLFDRRITGVGLTCAGVT
jgi:hypothetical protein